MNAVIIEGKPVGESVLQGEGAGPGPTSSALLSDLLSILSLVEKSMKAQKKPLPYPLLVASRVLTGFSKTVYLPGRISSQKWYSKAKIK